jgi:hypothetical protein
MLLSPNKEAPKTKKPNQTLFLSVFFHQISQSQWRIVANPQKNEQNGGSSITITQK